MILAGCALLAAVPLAAWWLSLDDAQQAVEEASSASNETPNAAEFGPPEPSPSDAAAAAQPFGLPAFDNSGPLRYDTEYPNSDYAGTALTGRLARLQSALDSGSVTLDVSSDQAFLRELLDALEIDLSSQALVFSKTSLQVDGVTPQTPRALYFNDDTYVAYVGGGASFEIASIDPILGPVFHTIARNGSTGGRLNRETNRCLRCHDSLSLTGGGVPRLLTGSGYIGTDGELVSHEAWILMRPWTPMKSRWGGWYVTGNHGDQVHLGNVVVQDISELNDVEAIRVGNRETVDGLMDASGYPTPYSDIIALLVLQHQLQAHNDIARLNWDLLKLTGVGWSALEQALEGIPSDEVDAVIYMQGEPLIETLVMAFDTLFTAPVSGSSGYTEWFETQGVTDADGRSLRELDLQTRLFRYPLSYTIYSEAFAALPERARRYIYDRVIEELSGGGRLELAARYPESARTAAIEILRETLPDLADDR